MPSTKIKIDQEDWDFIEHYKESTGSSIQSFVSTAIKERIIKVQTEQTVKDIPFVKPPTQQEINSILST